MDFFGYISLLMIVSINTIICDRQTVLCFGQETVVVEEACEILLFIFKKRGCYR